MKAIKKVSVTQIADNTGVIIDSLNTTDDKHSNAPSIEAVNGGLAGKANTSHTHTKSQITDFPTSLKNPNALTVKLNGTSQGGYDGSAAKTIDVTASSVGAVPASNFKVLTGTVAENNESIISYPSGFTKDNCVVVSIGNTQASTIYNYNAFGTTYDLLVQLRNADIRIFNNNNFEAVYKLLLMKVS